MNISKVNEAIEAEIQNGYLGMIGDPNFNRSKEKIFQCLINNQLKRTLGMFEYGKLPKTLSVRSMEKYLQGCGTCLAVEVTEEMIMNEAAKGKVTFLNFWFVDCVACVEEIPHFETFYKEYKNDVNMVCINPVDDLDYMNMGVTELGWDNYELNVGYPTGSVNLEKYFEIKEAYPFTAILDRNGVIKYLISGSIEYDKLISYYNAVK